jgi:hypothetical protein
VAILADVPLFAAIGKAVAMYMVAGTMWAFWCINEYSLVPFLVFL